MIITTGMSVQDDQQKTYEVLENIESGSFGSVFRIKENSTHNIYALKTFSEDLKFEELTNEMKAAIGIKNDNVLEYIYFHDGKQFSDYPPYLIMEYADGGNLAKLIDDRSKDGNLFKDEQVVSMIQQLIAGMRAVNSNFIHRDIKPNNILLSNNVLKIADFGLSKIIGEKTRSLTFKGGGTWPYMAPEVWESKKDTIQLDIYSMGIVFYELLTLNYPYSISTHGDIEVYKRAHLYSLPEPISKFNQKANITLCQIIEKMLAKELSKRYKNWEEINIDIEKISSEESNEVVSKIIEKRKQRKNEEDEYALSQKKRMDEINDYHRKIKYKIEADIIKPLETLLNELNKKDIDGKNEIVPARGLGRKDIFSYIIRLSSGNSLKIVLRPINEEDFVRMAPDPILRERLVRQIMMPKYRSQKNILAWGLLEAPDKSGFNLLLVEDNEDSHGKWIVLINTNYALANSSNRRTPEPFPFNFDEIEKEVNNIGAFHIYNINDKPFDINIIYDFIEQFS